MSKMEILAELPRLAPADRREIFDQLCEMEERDLLNGGATADEKALLDRELEEFHDNPEAGSSWKKCKRAFANLPAGEPALHRCHPSKRGGGSAW
jgi:hypothetical protein